MKTKKPTKITKAKKATNATTSTKSTKTKQITTTIDDVDHSWDQMSQAEELGRLGRELQKKYETQKVWEEQQLKTGEYTLLRNNDDDEITMSEIGQNAYNEYLAKGDTDDLALWRVVRNLGRSGFGRIFPRMSLITSGYEKWVADKSVITYGCCEMDSRHSFEFAFEEEKCINDLTMELLERKGLVTKDEYVKITSDANNVKLIHLDRGRGRY